MLNIGFEGNGQFSRKRFCFLPVQKKEYLFCKWYAVDALVTTDHEAVVFLEGLKLKPIRFTRTVRNYREHRKIEFTQKLSEWDWTTVGTYDDGESATSCLQSGHWTGSLSVCGDLVFLRRGWKMWANGLHRIRWGRVGVARVHPSHPEVRSRES